MAESGGRKGEHEEVAEKETGLEAMTPVASESQYIQFYLIGLRHALMRYRTYVIIGWGITLLGALGFVGAIHGVDRGELLVAGLPFVTMGAGILVVHLSIVGLETYVTTSFPTPDPGEIDEPARHTVAQCQEIMKGVAEGGWKEAFDAIGALGAMEKAMITDTGGVKS